MFPLEFSLGKLKIYSCWRDMMSIHSTQIYISVEKISGNDIDERTFNAICNARLYLKLVCESRERLTLIPYCFSSAHLIPASLSLVYLNLAHETKKCALT